jgi:endonuclease-8
MPEGPSILILKQALEPFRGKKILAVAGNTKIEKERMLLQKVIDFKTWGKHLLICFNNFTLRIHLMMFGTYRINERRDKEPRLHIEFANGEINFYSCALTFIDEPLNDVYDWESDVLNKNWSNSKALKKLRKNPSGLLCDVLLDQQVFSGVGNIIKNEVLFRIRLHPANRIGDLSPGKLRELVREAKNYSFDFLRWKIRFELKKHWLIYNKKICPRCNLPVRREIMGKTLRRTFYCLNCQKLNSARQVTPKKQALGPDNDH